MARLPTPMAGHKALDRWPKDGHRVGEPGSGDRLTSAHCLVEVRRSQADGLQPIAGPSMYVTGEIVELATPCVVADCAVRRDDEEIDVAIGMPLSAREGAKHRSVDEGWVEGSAPIGEALHQCQPGVGSAHNGIGQDMVTVEPEQLAAPRRLGEHQSVMNQPLQCQR